MESVLFYVKDKFLCQTFSHSQFDVYMCYCSMSPFDFGKLFNCEKNIFLNNSLPMLADEVHSK